MNAIDDVYRGAANQAGEDNRNVARMAAKRAASRTGGTVTRGNSSPLNDGAAALLLMSEEAVSRTGVTPLGRGGHVHRRGPGHRDSMGVLLTQRDRLDNSLLSTR